MSSDASFFGHPRGLSTLFFTEMWERFSYYGMRALLILFMTAAPAAGGLGFDTGRAGAIYGLYASMVYLATLPGGWIADRLIGAQRAVLYGGILIAAGHFSMAIPLLGTFYAGLILIVLGTGLLKGNVSIIVGRLYAPEDVRRDAGYSLFYMGINTGAVVAPVVCGYLGQRISWHLGFAAAGIGMTLGLIQYTLGRRHLGEAGLRPAEAGSSEESARQRRQAVRWLLAATSAIALVGIGMYVGRLSLSAVQVADAAGYALLILTVVFFGWLFLSPGWTVGERRRLYVLGVLFLASALFWSQFEQAGSTLNLFADRNTRNSILGWTFPSTWLQSFNALFIMLFAPVFAWMWVQLARRGREPSSAAKFGFGLILAGTGFAVLAFASTLAQGGARVSPMWLLVVYLLHTWGELSLSPVGMSATSVLAPARIAGLAMGVWFLGLSVGNYLGGRLASFYDTLPLATLFSVVASFGIGAGVVMLLMARPVSRLTKGS